MIYSFQHKIRYKIYRKLILSTSLFYDKKKNNCNKFNRMTQISEFMMFSDKFKHFSFSTCQKNKRVHELLVSMCG